MGAIAGVGYAGEGLVGEAELPVNKVVIGDLTDYIKPYDDHFDTAKDYKDSWVLPMSESQVVKFTKVVPIPPTGDPYWGAYTSEWLTIN